MRKRALIQIILVIQEPQNKTGKGGNNLWQSLDNYFEKMVICLNNDKHDAVTIQALVPWQPCPSQL